MAGTKYRIVRASGATAAIAGTGTDAAITTIGPVTLSDKLASYYHTFITVLGGVLVFLNEATPVTNMLPEMDRHYVTAAILILTAVLNALKQAVPANEAWLPPKA